MIIDKIRRLYPDSVLFRSMEGPSPFALPAQNRKSLQDYMRVVGELYPSEKCPSHPYDEGMGRGT